MNNRAPPASPDFRRAAVDQGSENERAATRQSTLNNPNWRGVGGSQTITIGPDGRPVVTQTLDPNTQRLYDQYTGNQGLAGDAARRMLQNGTVGGALDLSGLPDRPGNYEGVRQRVIDAMMTRANDSIQREGDQLNSDLVARGLRPGTEAYERERDALGRKENDYRTQAEAAGGQEAARAFANDLANRNSAFGERTAAYQLPMSAFATLMNGSRFQMPNMPNFQGNTQVAPAPLYGATTAQSNYDVDVWNAMQQQRNSNLNGGLGILGSIFGANSNSIGGRLLDRGLNYLGDNAGSWWDRFTGGGGGGGDYSTGPVDYTDPFDYFGP